MEIWKGGRVKRRSFELSPSKLNNLKFCPCFTQGPVGLPGKMGLASHDLLELKAKEVLEKNISPEELDWPVAFSAHDVTLEHEQIEDVRWGLETIFNLIRTLGLKDPIEVEEWGTVMDSDLIEIMNAKLDIACGKYVFDYKSGEMYDYKPQMCSYGLQRMQTRGLEDSIVVEVYGKKRQYKECRITAKEAEAEIAPIRKAYFDPNKQPSKNEFCGWCSQSKTCKEVLNSVAMVPIGSGEPENRGQDYIKTLLAKPQKDLTIDELAVLKPYADVVGSWAQRVKDSFRDGLIDDSRKTIGDYRVREDKGRFIVTDINKAFKLSGLTPAKFIQACSVSLPKLAIMYAQKYSVSKKYAREQIERLLTPILEREESIFKVVKSKGKN